MATRLQFLIFTLYLLQVQSQSTPLFIARGDPKKLVEEIKTKFLNSVNSPVWSSTLKIPSNGGRQQQSSHQKQTRKWDVRSTIPNADLESRNQRYNFNPKAMFTMRDGRPAIEFPGISGRSRMMDINNSAYYENTPTSITSIISKLIWRLRKSPHGMNGIPETRTRRQRKPLPKETSEEKKVKLYEPLGGLQIRRAQILKYTGRSRLTFAHIPALPKKDTLKNVLILVLPSKRNIRPAHILVLHKEHRCKVPSILTLPKKANIRTVQILGLPRAQNVRVSFLLGSLVRKRIRNAYLQSNNKPIYLLLVLKEDYPIAGLGLGTCNMRGSCIILLSDLPDEVTQKLLNKNSLPLSALHGLTRNFKAPGFGKTFEAKLIRPHYDLSFIYDKVLRVRPGGDNLNSPTVVKEEDVKRVKKFRQVFTNRVLNKNLRPRAPNSVSRNNARAHRLRQQIQMRQHRVITSYLRSFEKMHFTGNVATRFQAFFAYLKRPSYSRKPVFETDSEINTRLAKLGQRKQIINRKISRVVSLLLNSKSNLSDRSRNKPFYNRHKLLNLSVATTTAGLRRPAITSDESVSSTTIAHNNDSLKWEKTIKNEPKGSITWICSGYASMVFQTIKMCTTYLINKLLNLANYVFYRTSLMFTNTYPNFSARNRSLDTAVTECCTNENSYNKIDMKRSVLFNRSAYTSNESKKEMLKLDSEAVGTALTHTSNNFPLRKLLSSVTHHTNENSLSDNAMTGDNHIRKTHNTTRHKRAQLSGNLKVSEIIPKDPKIIDWVGDKNASLEITKKDENHENQRQPPISDDARTMAQRLLDLMSHVRKIEQTKKQSSSKDDGIHQQTDSHRVGKQKMDNREKARTVHISDQNEESKDFESNDDWEITQLKKDDMLGLDKLDLDSLSQRKPTEADRRLLKNIERLTFLVLGSASSDKRHPTFPSPKVLDHEPTNSYSGRSSVYNQRKKPKNIPHRLQNEKGRNDESQKHAKALINTGTETYERPQTGGIRSNAKAIDQRRRRKKKRKHIFSTGRSRQEASHLRHTRPSQTWNRSQHTIHRRIRSPILVKNIDADVKPTTFSGGLLALLKRDINAGTHGEAKIEARYDGRNKLQRDGTSGIKHNGNSRLRRDIDRNVERAVESEKTQRSAREKQLSIGSEVYNGANRHASFSAINEIYHDASMSIKRTASDREHHTMRITRSSRDAEMRPMPRKSKRAVKAISLMDEFRVHWPTLREKALQFRDVMLKLKKISIEDSSSLHRLLDLGDGYKEDAQEVAKREKDANLEMREQTAQFQLAEKEFSDFQKEINEQQSQTSIFDSNLKLTDSNGKVAKNLPESTRDEAGKADDDDSHAEQSFGAPDALNTESKVAPQMLDSPNGKPFSDKYKKRLKQVIGALDSWADTSQDANVAMAAADVKGLISKANMTNVESRRRRLTMTGKSNVENSRKRDYSVYVEDSERRKRNWVKRALEKRAPQIRLKERRVDMPHTRKRREPQYDPAIVFSQTAVATPYNDDGVLETVPLVTGFHKIDYKNSDDDDDELDDEDVDDENDDEDETGVDNGVEIAGFVRGDDIDLTEHNLKETDGITSKAVLNGIINGEDPADDIVVEQIATEDSNNLADMSNEELFGDRTATAKIRRDIPMILNDVGIDTQLMAASETDDAQEILNYEDPIEKLTTKAEDVFDLSLQDTLDELEAETLAPKEQEVREHDAVISSLLSAPEGDAIKSVSEDANLLDSIPSLESIEDVGRLLKEAGRDYSNGVTLRNAGVDVDTLFDRADLEPYNEVIEESMEADPDMEYLRRYQQRGKSPIEREILRVVKSRQKADKAVKNVIEAGRMVNNSISPGKTKDLINNELEVSLNNLRQEQIKQEEQRKLFTEEEQRKEGEAIKALKENSKSLLKERLEQYDKMQADLNEAAQDQDEVSSRRAQMYDDVASDLKRSKEDVVATDSV